MSEWQKDALEWQNRVTLDAVAIIMARAWKPTTNHNIAILYDSR